MGQHHIKLKAPVSHLTAGIFWTIAGLVGGYCGGLMYVTGNYTIERKIHDTGQYGLLLDYTVLGSAIVAAFVFALVFILFRQPQSPYDPKV